MTQTLFIADLHLDKRFPKALSAFQHFLIDLRQQKTDALYILGDLFEYWLGDDCLDKTAITVAQALFDYRQQTQTPIFFIHGNRDFLLGESYAKRCEMTLLPEYQAINLYGTKTLLCHGDTLCTDDIAYMDFRAKVRHPEWQRKVYNMPKWLRRLKAMQLRRQSKKANQQKSQGIMDVSQTTVVKTMRDNDVRQLIHGHTHRPAIHAFETDNVKMTRCVVGDWYEQGSVLRVTASGAELLRLPFTQVNR